MPLDIPMPWLRGPNTLEALSSGASAGASAGRLEQESVNESARLGMESMRLRQSAAMQQAQLQQSAEQHEMEFQARQKTQQQNQLREDQRLNIENAYKNASLGIAKGRLEQTQAAAEEKAKAAALTFQREQGFAKAVASGVPVMDAYRQFPVSSALLNTVSRTQLKSGEDKPVIREGKFPIIKINPATGQAETIYTPPKVEGLSAADKEDLKDLRAKRKDLASRVAGFLTPADQKPALNAQLSELDKRIEAIKHPAPKSGTNDTSEPSKFGHPKVGEVRAGYRFKGGDPNDQKSWELVSDQQDSDQTEQPYTRHGTIGRRHFPTGE
jgi:hypothetical protein